MEKKRVTFGELLSETGNVIAERKGLFLAYLAVFIPIVALGNYLDDDVSNGFLNYRNGPAGLAVLFLSVIAQFMIFERIIPDIGQGDANRVARMGGFVLLGLLTFLATSLAAIFFLLPGLFVGARLLMSPAIYASGEGGAIAAMRESWDTTRGSTRSVALAVFSLLVVIFLLSSIGGTLSFSFNSQSYETGFDLVGSRHILDAVRSELFGVGLIAMSIATFRCLVDRTQDLQGIFE